jgi:hypothetical protein
MLSIFNTDSALLKSLHTAAPDIDHKVLKAEAESMRTFVVESMKDKVYEPTVLMKMALNGVNTEN